ncbi:MAG: hypothetical protein Q4D45_06670 [Lachnospiraceae bacterium]|nr:hypothetical protein [Lachnospiraceae bacterium]
MMNYEQEIDRIEAGIDEEKIKKMIFDGSEEAASLQQNKLDQVLKRYNLAVNYCKTDSYDLAYIQIQKVTRLIPDDLNAQLLAALICIHEGKISQANKALERAALLDANNLIVKQYQSEIAVPEEPQEVEEAPKEEKKTVKSKTTEKTQEKAKKTPTTPVKKKQKPEKKQEGSKKVVANGSDYEEVTSNKKGFVYLGVGFLIGVIAMFILVVPTLKSSLQSQYTNKADSYEDQLKAKDSEITSLKEDLKEAEADTKAAEKEAKSYKDGNKDLLEAANEYLKGNTTSAAENLMDINTKILTTDAAKNLYNNIKSATYSKAANSFYNNGLQQWYKKNYSEAKKQFKKAIKADDTNPNYYYYLARTYEADGDSKNAIKNYNEVVKLNKSFVSDSKRRIERLEAEKSTTEKSTEKKATTEE